MIKFLNDKVLKLTALRSSIRVQPTAYTLHLFYVKREIGNGSVVPLQDASGTCNVRQIIIRARALHAPLRPDGAVSTSARPGKQRQQQQEQQGWALYLFWS